MKGLFGLRKCECITYSRLLRIENGTSGLNHVHFWNCMSQVKILRHAVSEMDTLSTQPLHGESCHWRSCWVMPFLCLEINWSNESKTKIQTTMEAPVLQQVHMAGNTVDKVESFASLKDNNSRSEAELTRPIAIAWGFTPDDYNDVRLLGLWYLQFINKIFSTQLKKSFKNKFADGYKTPYPLPCMWWQTVRLVRSDWWWQRA